MTCRDLIEFLAEYVDDRLDTGVRTEFDHHLGLCPACRDYLRTYRRTLEATRSLVAEEVLPGAPPLELVAAVLAARRAR